MMLIYNR